MITVISFYTALVVFIGHELKYDQPLEGVIADFLYTWILTFLLLYRSWHIQMRFNTLQDYLPLHVAIWLLHYLS